MMMNIVVHQSNQHPKFHDCRDCIPGFAPYLCRKILEWKIFFSTGALLEDKLPEGLLDFF
jgi:hypothetical protein